MRRTILVALLGMAVLLLGALAWLKPGSLEPSQVDAGRAGTLALDFYSQHHAPSDSLSNVRVVSEKQTTGSSGQAAWEVQVAGGVTQPGSSFTYESAMVLDVDASTGTVTLVAAG